MTCMLVLVGLGLILMGVMGVAYKMGDFHSTQPLHSVADPESPWVLMRMCPTEPELVMQLPLT